MIVHMYLFLYNLVNFYEGNKNKNLKKGGLVGTALLYIRCLVSHCNGRVKFQFNYINCSTRKMILSEGASASRCNLQ